MAVIHKSARPKKDYCDPTMCGVSNRLPWINMRTEETWKIMAYRAMSRTRWDNVTCKRCLKFKGKRRRFLV